MAKKPKRKKRNVLGSTAALAKLDQMMPILETNIIGALMIEATLDVGNNIVRDMASKEISGAKAYNTIKQSLTFDLAMHLARMFDKGSRRFHANDKDAASIPLMIRLLRQKRCRRMLVHRARRTNDIHKELADLFENDCIKALEKASKAYSATFRGKLGKSGLKRLKTARDHHFAHSLMSNKKLDLIYNHLFRLVDCARECLDPASIAITGTALELSKLEEDFKEEAVEFWNRALLGAAQSHDN